MGFGWSWGYLDLDPMICGYWLVMWGGHDLDSNGYVIIAYLAMDCDLMLHTRNAMWIHWFICWLCKWLSYLLELQMLIFNCWYCNWWFIGFGFVVVHP